MGFGPKNEIAIDSTKKDSHLDHLYQKMDSFLEVFVEVATAGWGLLQLDF